MSEAGNGGETAVQTPKKKQPPTPYTVFEEIQIGSDAFKKLQTGDLVYVQLGTTETVQGDVKAIEEVVEADRDGSFVAVPSRSFRVRVTETETKTVRRIR